jgi:hypothetical protein
MRDNMRMKFISSCKADNMAFLEANRKRLYMEYVRDPSNVPTNEQTRSKGKPTAVMVALKDDDGTIHVGWAAAQQPLIDQEFGDLIRRGDEFNKPIGLWKAIRRATGAGRAPKRVHPRLPIAEFQERAVKQFEAKAKV